MESPIYNCCSSCETLSCRCPVPPTEQAEIAYAKAPAQSKEMPFMTFDLTVFISNELLLCKSRPFPANRLFTSRVVLVNALSGTCQYLHSGYQYLQNPHKKKNPHTARTSRVRIPHHPPQSFYSNLITFYRVTSLSRRISAEEAPISNFTFPGSTTNLSCASSQ